MKIEGKLRVKFEAKQVSQNLKKREFVLEYAENPAYPQFLKFELLKDKCSLIDKFNVGDFLEVSFNLRGKEWKNQEGESSYYNSLEAWRIQKANSGAQPESNAPASAFQMTDISTNEGDDLPF